MGLKAQNKAETPTEGGSSLKFLIWITKNYTMNSGKATTTEYINYLYVICVSTSKTPDLIARDKAASATHVLNRKSKMLIKEINSLN